MKLSKQRKKYMVLIMIVILAGPLAYFSWEEVKNSPEAETYSSAEIRCGQKPVIGAGEDELNKDKTYYAPGPPNKKQSYDLMSLYDPANVDLSKYSNPEFFCNVEEARSAGYVRHKCCGLIEP